MPHRREVRDQGGHCKANFVSNTRRIAVGVLYKRLLHHRRRVCRRQRGLNQKGPSAGVLGPLVTLRSYSTNNKPTGTNEPYTHKLKTLWYAAMVSQR
jgi:hypothetical protein